MTDGRHIIWSNDIDYDDWKEDLEEQYPEQYSVISPDSCCRGLGTLVRPPYGVQGNQKR